MDRSHAVVHELLPSTQLSLKAQVDQGRNPELKSSARSGAAKHLPVATWSHRAWCASALHNDYRTRLSQLFRTPRLVRVLIRDG